MIRCFYILECMSEAWSSFPLWNTCRACMQKTTLKSPDPTMRMLHTHVPDPRAASPTACMALSCLPCRPSTTTFATAACPLPAGTTGHTPSPTIDAKNSLSLGSSGQLFFFGGGCARSPANENIWGSGQWQNFAGPHGPAKYSSVPIGPAAQRTETLLHPHPPSPASSLVCWCVHSNRLVSGGLGLSGHEAALAPVELLPWQSRARIWRRVRSSE